MKYVLIILLFGLLACGKNGDGTARADASNAEVTTDTLAEETPDAATILAIDAELGAARNHDPERMPLSAAIDNYVTGLNAIDFSATPPAFAGAFREHIAAWEATKAVTDLYPDERGEMHDLFSQIEAGADSAAFKPLVQRIWSTWDAVEAAAPDSK